MTNTEAEFEAAMQRYYGPRKSIDAIAPMRNASGLHLLPTTATYSDSRPEREPLEFCNGNCRRAACDCVPDVDDSVGRSPRIPEGGGLAVAFLLVAGIVSCVLALSYVVRVL